MSLPRSSLVGGVCLLFGCVVCPSPAGPSSLSAGAGLSGPEPRDGAWRAHEAASKCSLPEGSAEHPSLSALMRDAVNPRLSQLSLRLFHDRRDSNDEARSEEIRELAEQLAACFVRVSWLSPKAAPSPAGATAGSEAGGGSTDAEFQVYSRMAHDSARALGHTAYIRHHAGVEHWFMHLKETCQGCHLRFRPANKDSTAVRSASAEALGGGL